MPMRVAARIVPVLPGTALSIAVTLAAVGLEYVEVRLFGRAWLESSGAGDPHRHGGALGLDADDRFSLGIRFSAKTLLEIAVVLLGASVSARAVMAAGPMLLFGIVGVVVRRHYHQLRHRPPARAWSTSWRRWSPAAIPSAAIRRSSPPPR